MKIPWRENGKIIEKVASSKTNQQEQTEAETAKWSGSHPWVCHYPTSRFKPHYCWVFLLRLPVPSQESYSSKCNQSCPRSAAYWALLHTYSSLTPPMQAQRTVCTYSTQTHVHKHTNIPISAGPPTSFSPFASSTKHSRSQLWAAQMIGPTETVRPFKHFHPSYRKEDRNEQSHPSFPLESPWGSFRTKGEKSLSAGSLTDQVGRWREEEKENEKRETKEHKNDSLASLKHII